MSSRIALQRQLFPAGIPKLWCPTLSYFSAAGQFDEGRMADHLRRLAPFVKGILVPGSTGEGWEMTDQQIMELLAIVLPVASELNLRLLIGILKTDTDQVLKTVDSLQRLLEHPAAVGITICPAKGSEKSQTDIHAGLTRVLKLGIPTALYQLPQVTQNEMSTETVANLAEEFPNFILFKDTSGEDRVASTIVGEHGVFMVRGSEKGGYANWLRSAGGKYDGFLLSTANCFASQLSETIRLLDSGQREQAEKVSHEIQQTVEAAFRAVSSFGVGNAFTNANKAIDHLIISGTAFRELPTPMLLSGTRLPMEILELLAAAAPQLLHGLQVHRT